MKPVQGLIIAQKLKMRGPKAVSAGIRFCTEESVKNSTNSGDDATNNELLTTGPKKGESNKPAKVSPAGTIMLAVLKANILSNTAQFPVKLLFANATSPVPYMTPKLWPIKCTSEVLKSTKPVGALIPLNANLKAIISAIL
jgi:hypothetical protein